MAQILEFPHKKQALKTSVGIKMDEAWARAFHCRHVNFVLDFKDRTVRCRECGAVVDPFFALQQFAIRERDFIFNNAKAKAAIEEFKKIQAEWKLTTREKRRIKNAQNEALLIAKDELWKETQDS